jgi:hypothetical protein
MGAPRLCSVLFVAAAAVACEPDSKSPQAPISADAALAESLAAAAAQNLETIECSGVVYHLDADRLLVLCLRSAFQPLLPVDSMGFYVDRDDRPTLSEVLTVVSDFSASILAATAVNARSDPKYVAGTDAAFEKRLIIWYLPQQPDHIVRISLSTPIGSAPFP